MRYLVSIYAYSFEFDKYIKKIIHSLFKEWMKDFIMIQNDNESSLSVILKEDFPEEFRKKLCAYFNIKLKVFKINQPTRTFHFQQLEGKEPSSKDTIGLYQTNDKIIYPYMQSGGRVYFLNPVDNNHPTIKHYHNTATKVIDFISTKSPKKICHFESNMDFYFDYLQNITNPSCFIYNLFQIKESPYFNLKEFSYAQSSQNGFALFYNNDIYKIIVSINGVKNGIPYGDIHLMYHNTQPFKSKAYSKKRKDALKEYIIEILSKEETLYYWHRPYFNLSRNEFSIEGINLYNLDYYVLIGCMLDRYDESMIPICFDKVTIKESYERFQSFEMLYQLKSGHNYSA